MPGILLALLIAVMLCVVGVLVLAVVRSVVRSARRQNDPLLSVDARVAAKCREAGPIAVFTIGSGNQVEFTVTEETFAQLAEGDAGKLTFQGERFVSFAISPLPPEE